MIEADLASGLAAVASLLAGAGARARRRERIVSRVADPPEISGVRRDRRIGALRRSRLKGPILGFAGAGLGYVVAAAPGAVAGLLAGLSLPAAARRRAASRRAQSMEAHLAEAARSIGAGLRAGMSLTQSLEFAAGDAEPPLSDALQSVVDRTGLGISLDAALMRWAADEPTPDVRLVVGVLRLHRRTGGDLPALLDRLGQTLRERRAAAMEVRSLTAQARLSGAILGLLPVGFFLFLSATSRDDVAAAFQSKTGIVAIAAGFVMQGTAFVWIRHLLRVNA